MASTAKYEWPMVRLGDVCSINPVTKFRTSTANTEISFVSMDAVSVEGKLDYTEKRTVDAVKSGYSRFNQGDVLLAKITPCFENGKSAIAEIETSVGAGSTEFHIFRPFADLDSRYLHYFLRTPALRAVGEANMRGSSGHRRVPSWVFANAKIPLPPLDEQRRIAAILDAVDDALARVKQSLGDLLQLKQELFTDLFLRMERESTAIGEYLESTQYGTSDKANENVGIPVLRMGNVSYNGEIDLSDLKYVELDIKDREKYSLKAGDLLFNRTNSKDLVGKTAVVPAFPEEYTYAGYLIRCRVNDKAVPEYISGYLNSVLGKKILRNTAKSIVGMANINANELKRLPIPKASLDEQQEFASSISRIEDVESQMKRQRKLLQELQESLSARAFQGEL